MSDRTRGLILGDGDGRFLAALLKQNADFLADAVDSSAAMLDLLRSRCQRSAPDAELRVRIHQTDALTYLSNPSPMSYDLVITHFFLDCFAQSEVEALAASVLPTLSPAALWVVSDFRIPPGFMQIPAKLLIGTLYLAFRILTGLRVNQLPNHTFALTRAGLVRITASNFLFGILTTEIWTFPSPSASTTVYNCE